MFQPVIKWSGSKRSQADRITKYFTKNIDTYYEPFCGGASILRAVIESSIKVNKYVCSDVNPDLIKLWGMIKENPDYLSNEYKLKWEHMNKSGDKTQEFKKRYYEEVRDDFNKDEIGNRKVSTFLFLDRTCFNGLIRYNSKGEFNSPFHLNRNGIEPKKLDKVIKEWSKILNENNVEFKCCSYSDIQPKEGDFIYLDPPYANTNGMYFDNFDNEEFFKWLREQPCKWALSYDGKSGKEDNTYSVPKDLYRGHIYIQSGNSSFKRIKEVDKNAVVYESLYLNY